MLPCAADDTGIRHLTDASPVRSLLVRGATPPAPDPSARRRQEPEQGRNRASLTRAARFERQANESLIPLRHRRHTP